MLKGELSMLVCESKATKTPYMDSRIKQNSSQTSCAGKKIKLASGETLRVTNDAFVPAITKGLQPSMLIPLADGRVPALHMKKAINLDWCDQVSERFANHPATHKEGVSPPIYSLGSHLYSCLKGEASSCYFQGIEQQNQAISHVLPNRYDPIVSFLRDACELNDAQFEYLSHEGATVRHGALRLWGGGSQASDRGRCYFAMPHEDYEETNDNNPLLHQIHGVDNVYSIIFCIDAVEGHEPETIVWDRRITLDEINDPANHHPWANYGFSESLLDGVDAMSFQLKKGDAAIIPAHHIHAVIGFPGFRRCTYMAFFHFVKTPSGGFSKIIFRT